MQQRNAEKVQLHASCHLLLSQIILQYPDLYSLEGAPFSQAFRLILAVKAVQHVNESSWLGSVAIIKHSSFE
ncbi:hypothetical protein ATANTOWER_008175 [Ataeniobius toweri]|uniref:Uncharacterized protein n=1 Tax=Ataeniobius toweri TaxID=208326 RepID=A0ABU7BH25_9TELE|nr:hypothetical protein [Ataeniobius toweri]